VFRLYFILVFGFFSCNQSTENRPKVVEVTLDPANMKIDSSSRIWDAFNWGKWKKPKHKETIYLSDDLLKYVTKGHMAIDASYGDVNEDGILDLVTITAPINEDSVLSAHGDLSRDLLIFFRQDNDSFKLALKTTKAIPRFNWCDSADSFGGHTALTGRLIINKSCISELKSRSEYRFRYEQQLKDWLLDTIVIETFPFKNDKYVLDTFTKKDFGSISLKKFDIHKAP
jgi:hypothetical protein